MAEQILNPIALDFNDLAVYDKKIKEYIDEKAASVSPDTLDTYTKAEIDLKLSNVNKEAIIAIDQRLDELSENVAVLLDDRDEAENDIISIKAANIVITQEIANIKAALENKADESKIPSLQGYATEEYVKAKIAEAEFNQTDIDLSNYVTKEEFQRVSDQSAANNKLIFDIGSELVRIDETLESIPTKTSQLDNDAGFITSIPSEYVTESELDSKGYITDVSNFATHEEVQEAVSAHVEEEIETTIKNNIQDEVATQLSKNETIQYGTFGEI